MKLYELTQNYLNLQELLENEEIPKEMVIDALDNVGEELEAKAENIAKLIKTLEVDITGYKAEETRLALKRKSLENRVKSLKEYLDNAMKVTGKTEFKGQLFSFSIQKNPPSVNVIDEKLIPEEYFIPQEPALDKKRLLSDLKSGIKVEGAEVKQTESLRIK